MAWQGRDRKVRYSEYVYVYIVEVISGNGDAFVSLTVNDGNEFLQTVACGRSDDPEVLYTHLNTGYKTKHWLILDFMPEIPAWRKNCSSSQLITALAFGLIEMKADNNLRCLCKFAPG